MILFKINNNSNYDNNNVNNNNNNNNLRWYLGENTDVRVT